MIRIRRYRPRFPFGRVYEMEYQSRDRSEDWHGLTRFPTDFAEPILGKAEAKAFVEQADQEWAASGANWTRSGSSAPAPTEPHRRIVHASGGGG